MKKAILMSLLGGALILSVPILAQACPGGGPGGPGGPGGGPRGGQMFDKMDADADGNVSKEEFLKGAEERFSKMDLDGNGTVTREEAQEAHAKMKAEWKGKGPKGPRGPGGPGGGPNGAAPEPAPEE